MLLETGDLDADDGADPLVITSALHRPPALSPTPIRLGKPDLVRPGVPPGRKRGRAAFSRFEPAPLATVVVGGIIPSTIVTLLILAVLYRMVHRPRRPAERPEAPRPRGDCRAA